MKTPPKFNVDQVVIVIKSDEEELHTYTSTVTGIHRYRGGIFYHLKGFDIEFREDELFESLIKALSFCQKVIKEFLSDEKEKMNCETCKEEASR